MLVCEVLFFKGGIVVICLFRVGVVEICADYGGVYVFHICFVCCLWCLD